MRVRIESGIMAADHEKWPNRRALLLYAAGFCMLAFAFLFPDEAYWEGRSFFNVARQSPWNHWWDWPAAWCSVKIILLSLGVFSIMTALRRMLKVSRCWAKAILLLSSVSSLVCALGVYYLLKALL